MGTTYDPPHPGELVADCIAAEMQRQRHRLNAQPRHRAADGEDGDGGVEVEFPHGALGGAGHGDEGAYLEAALPCFPPSFRVCVSSQAHLVVGQPAV